MALLLTLVVPRALDQVQTAVEGCRLAAGAPAGGERVDGPPARDPRRARSSGWRSCPSAEELVDPAVEVTLLAFEVLVGIFFVLASAAYWIYERERAVTLVTSLLPRPRAEGRPRHVDLIDLKLGAYVRGQAILIVLVGTVLSLIFLAIGAAVLAPRRRIRGRRRDRPRDRAARRRTLAVGVGLTVWQLGVAAGIAVLVVRLLEDYLVIPRVLGDAVGLSPLIVLFAVTATALLFGEFAVLLAIPIAAVVGTLVDVIVLKKDPAEEDVPTVIFSAKETETVGLARPCASGRRSSRRA